MMHGKPDRLDVPETRWHRSAVLTILTNDVYTGTMHGQTNAHPAIISRRLYNQAQAQLDARRRSG